MNILCIRAGFNVLLRPWGRALVACAALTPCVIGRAEPSEVPDAPRPDVMTADREFAQLALDAGIRVAYDRYLGADAVVFRPLPVPAREWLAAHEPASGRLEWSPLSALTACDASLAVTFGSWRYTARDSNASDTGQYLTAWRRTENGEWRIVLDQSLSVAALPANTATRGSACDPLSSSADAVRAADRKRNDRMRSLPQAGMPTVAVRALTLGTVTGSAQAEIALTHGEFVDRRPARGVEPQVRAVYVRVWLRDGRAWRLQHEFTSSVAP